MLLTALIYFGSAAPKGGLIIALVKKNALRCLFKSQLIMIRELACAVKPSSVQRAISL